MSVLHETGLETPLHKNFAKFKKKKNSNPQNLNHIVILQLKHIQKKKNALSFCIYIQLGR